MNAMEECENGLDGILDRYLAERRQNCEED